MNPLEHAYMLDDARSRAAREFARYPQAQDVRVTVDRVVYTFRRQDDDMTLIDTQKAVV